MLNECFVNEVSLGFIVMNSTAMPTPCHPDQACRPYALSNRTERPGRRGEGSPVNVSWLRNARSFPACAVGGGTALRGGRAAHAGQDDSTQRLRKYQRTYFTD